MQVTTPETVETVQYDDATWVMETGPNAKGYYRITRMADGYKRVVYAHGSHLKFQPEPADVMEVVDALYGVYLNQHGNAGDAEVATVKALETLGWGYVRAYHAASHTASAHR